MNDLNNTELLRFGVNCPLDAAEAIASVFTPTNETAQMFATLVSVGSFAFIVPTLLLAVYRHKQARGRFPWLQMLSAMGAVVCITTFSLRDAIGREQYPCDVMLAGYALWLPLNVGSCAICWWQSYMKLRVQNGAANLHMLKSGSRASIRDDNKSRSDSKVDSDNQKQMRILATLKWRSSNGFGLLLFAMFCLVACAVLTFNLVTQVQFQSGCTGCEFVEFDQIIWHAGGAPIILFVLGFSFYSRADLMIHGDMLSDRTHIMKDMIKVAFVWGIDFALFVPLFFVDPDDMYATGQLNYFHIISIASVCTYYFLVVAPMLRSMGPMFGSSEEVRMVSFHDVLADKEGDLLTLFRRHLVTEYSIENLRFVEDVATWKQSALDSMKQTSAGDFVSSQSLKLQARWIYETYMSPSAVLGVNVSGDTQDLVARVFAGSRRKGSPASTTGALRKLTPTVFDESANVMYRTMESDTFPRFLRSAAYRTFMNQRQRKPTFAMNSTLVASQAEEFSFSV